MYLRRRGSMMYSKKLAGFILDILLMSGRCVVPALPAASIGVALAAHGAHATDGDSDQLTRRAAIDDPASAGPACGGDCDGNGVVGVNEIVICVNIVLGNVQQPVCPACDADGDGVVAVNDVVASVQNILAGCTPEPGSVDANRIAGTWRISWTTTTCPLGVGTGGNTENYIVTAIDTGTIRFGWSGSQVRYNLPLTPTQDGGMEAVWTTTSDTTLVCSRDNEVGQMKFKDTLHFNPDNSTGYVNQTWTFGANTVCPSCSASSQSAMSKVSAGSSGRMSSALQEGRGLKESGHAIGTETTGGDDTGGGWLEEGTGSR
jgi:hypothetical protein